MEAGVLSSVNALLILVGALAPRMGVADLGGVPARLDREHLGLVSAGFADAGGSHEGTVTRWTDQGARIDRLDPLVDWLDVGCTSGWPGCPRQSRNNIGRKCRGLRG